MNKQMKIAVLMTMAMIAGVSAQNMDSREGDSLALVALKNKNPQADFKWDFTLPLDKWERITIENERVTNIEFPYYWQTKTPSPYPNIFTKISIVPQEFSNLTHLKELNLEGARGCDISVLGELVALEFLSLRNCGLSTLLFDISKLRNLVAIDLSWNQFSYLPSGVCSLPKLKWLDLMSTPLVSLPDEIGNLTSLTSLSLNNELMYDKSRITELPNTIGNLKNLTSLGLAGNKLERVPTTIGNLTNLTSLRISANKLSELPSEIGGLVNLTSLDLSRNSLSSLPQEIGRLTLLKNLDISSNILTSLPVEITNLSSLSSDLIGRRPLNTSDNQLSSELTDTVKSWLDKYDPNWAATQKKTSLIYPTKTLGKTSPLTASFIGTSLNFSSDLPTGTAVSLFDLSGRQIFTGSVTGRSLNVGSLATGVYITRIGSGSAVRSMKLIVQ